MNKLLVFIIFFYATTLFAIEEQRPKVIYKKESFNVYKPKNYVRCEESGGIVFHSPYYSVSQLYTIFEEKYKECGSYKTKHSGNLEEKRKLIKDKAKEMSEDEECPEFKDISKQYITKHERTMSKLALESKSLKEKILLEAQNDKDIQVNASYLAWGYNLCNSGHHTKELPDRLEYIRDIEEIKYGEAPIIISKDGETVKDCFNVSASGGVEGLKEFYIDITGASDESAVISYNTYSVPDNVKVLDDKDNLLLDSGCVGTHTNKARIIPINKKKFSKIKIQVDALCGKSKGSTGWQLHFSCGPRPEPPELPPEETKRRRHCREKAQVAIKRLQENVEFTLDVQRGQWMRAVCQKKNYTKVVGDYTDFNTLLHPQISGSFDRLNLDVDPNYLNAPAKLVFEKINNKHDQDPKQQRTILDISMSGKNSAIGQKSLSMNVIDEEKIRIDKELQKTIANIKSKEPRVNKKYKVHKFDESKRKIFELLGEKIPEAEARSLANIPPVIRHEVTPFVYGYNDFIKKKSRYCPAEPGKQESLLKRVSFAYCRYAFPRLFGVEDDD